MAKQIKTTKPTTAPKKLVKMTKESMDKMKKEDEMMKKDMAQERKNKATRQNQPTASEFKPAKKKK